jgi:Tfp pilus assembly protein PilP
MTCHFKKKQGNLWLMKKTVLFGLLLLVLVGCSPSSLEDFQHEGESLSRKLIKELAQIHNKSELHQAAPQLQKRFEQIVDLMIAARKYQQTHPDEDLMQDSPVSDALVQELKRIYQIEGGRQVIEKAQREALIRLDAFEKSSDKQSQLFKR